MLLTLAEGKERNIGGTEYTGVDTVELRVGDAPELSVLGSLLTERSAGDDAVDVEGVAWMLRVCNGVLDQRVLVLDALGFGKVNHLVGDVLLRARVGVGEEGVDATNGTELVTRVTRGGITTARTAEVCPARSHCGEICLRDPADQRGVRRPFGYIIALFRLARSGSLRGTTVGAYDDEFHEHRTLLIYYTDASNSDSERPNKPPDAPVAAIRA